MGSELTSELRKVYGIENVIATDIAEPNSQVGEVNFEYLDVLKRSRLEDIIEKYDINIVYHLAALLSATAENNIKLAWKLNMDGLLNVLNVAKEKSLEKVFWPSSIAVFGPNAPKNNSPQDSFCNPSTMYGVTKLAGEQLCAYYHQKFGVDVRSLRYPGLIGYKSLPSGGTTDYAVEIYYKALAGDIFTCFIEKSEALPMMYMKDAVKATIEIMEAPTENINIRTSYNVSAISFTPEDITKSIRSHLLDFEIVYKPDYRQQIAATWPNSIDDSKARNDWGWKPNYDLEKMTTDILINLSQMSTKM